MPIFVDTGAWYALLDKNDSDHTTAAEFTESLTHSMVTTNYVADEIITLAKNRLGHGIAVEIGGKLWNESIATLVHVTSRMRRKHGIYLPSIGIKDSALQIVQALQSWNGLGLLKPSHLMNISINMAI